MAEEMREIDGVEVSVSTIKSALKKAGIELKLKEDKYERYLLENPFEYIRYNEEGGLRIITHKNRRYIVVPLPNANKDWTLKTFAWVKDFCNKFKFESYPVHGNEVPDNKNIYIKIPDKENK